MKDRKSQNILKIVEKEKTISTKELFSRLLEHEPDLKYTTLTWRIYALREKGLIRNVGRGLYSLGKSLPIFHAPINRKIRLINNTIKKSFPYLNFSIWTTQWLSDYMLHQPMNYITIVDVDPDASSSVFNKLRDKWDNTKVLYRPSAEEFDRYAVGVQNLIIVKDLISEAPIEDVAGFSAPLLEKIIVDLFMEKNIFSAFGGKELSIIFDELDSHYLISRSKLLRYARRRGAEKLLKKLKIPSNEVLGDIGDYR